jgi:predicted O-methyltransferase YrrM
LAAALHFILWKLRFRQARTETSRSERDALARYAQNRLRAVEIGVAQGVTSKRLRACLAPEGELWAVDPYPPNRLGLRFSEMIAHGEVASIENARVRWVRRASTEAAALWRDERRPPPDFVFIDADHSWKGISEDWEAWSGLVGPGAIIALHDSRSTPEHPMEAGSVHFTQSVVLQDSRFRLVEEVDSLTVVERRAEPAGIDAKPVRERASS